MAQKPSQTDPGTIRIYESEGGKDSLDDATEYSGLTDSAFNTDEHEPSTFVVGLEDEDDVDDVDPDAVRKEEHIATAIRAVAELEMSYSDVASEGESDGLVPYSREWVGRRYREWRDNSEHQDLVDVDPPEGETA